MVPLGSAAQLGHPSPQQGMACNTPRPGVSLELRGVRKGQRLQSGLPAWARNGSVVNTVTEWRSRAPQISRERWRWEGLRDRRACPFLRTGTAPGSQRSLLPAPGLRVSGVECETQRGVRTHRSSRGRRKLQASRALSGSVQCSQVWRKSLSAKSSYREQILTIYGFLPSTF